MRLAVQSRWTAVATAALLWLLICHVQTVQAFLEQEPLQRGLSYWDVAPRQYLRFAFWALATPAILWLGRRFSPLASRRLFPLALHLALSLLCGLGFAFARFVIWVQTLEFDKPFGFTPTWLQIAHDYYISFWLTVNPRLFADVTIYWMILGAGCLLQLTRRSRDLELRHTQMQALVSQAELSALKQRLQPHFLFNALNSVAMLIRQKEEEKSIDTLAQISALLRALINSTQRQQVPVEQELDFTQRYLEVEKIRFGDRLAVRYEVDPAALQFQVPALLLQPLVENAIKHGISRRSAPGVVTITISVAHGGLELRIHNDNGDDVPPEADRAHIGLATTRERLRHRYGDAARLTTAFNQPGGSRVTIHLPAEPFSQP
jgi:sensor histidine kinase YesM